MEVQRGASESGPNECQGVRAEGDRPAAGLPPAAGPIAMGDDATRCSSERVDRELRVGQQLDRELDDLIALWLDGPLDGVRARR